MGQSFYINPASPELRYTGRIDDRNPQAPVLAWQGCRIECRFRTRASLVLVQLTGFWRNYCQVWLNGHTTTLEIQAGPGEYPLDLSGVPPDADGAVTLCLFKRTEAHGGEFTFQGLEFPEEAWLLPLPPAPALGIEIYGDSISAGACNQDPGADQYDTLATHNNYLSYGAIAARDLGAVYANCAISGIGLCESWNEFKAPLVRDKVRLQDLDLTWDFSRWQPDLVVVNLGQNDSGFPQSQNRPFPADFSTVYTDYILAIHHSYPGALIVHANGGMEASFKDPALVKALALARENLADAGLETPHFTFQAWSSNHPRVDVHQRMARELVDFLRPWCARRPQLAGAFRRG